MGTIGALPESPLYYTFVRHGNSKTDFEYVDPETTPCYSGDADANTWGTWKRKLKQQTYGGRQLTGRAEWMICHYRSIGE